MKKEQKIKIRLKITIMEVYKREKYTKRIREKEKKRKRDIEKSEIR